MNPCCSRCLVGHLLADACPTCPKKPRACVRNQEGEPHHHNLGKVTHLLIHELGLIQSAFPQSCQPHRLVLSEKEWGETWKLLFQFMSKGSEVMLELSSSMGQRGEIKDSGRQERCSNRGGIYGALICRPSRSCIPRH